MLKNWFFQLFQWPRYLQVSENPTNFLSQTVCVNELISQFYCWFLNSKQHIFLSTYQVTCTKAIKVTIWRRKTVQGCAHMRNVGINVGTYFLNGMAASLSLREDILLSKTVFNKYGKTLMTSPVSNHYHGEVTMQLYKKQFKRFLFFFLPL